ncbi:MAG: iron-containing alcohol dehydrogenase [Lentisphaeria bacterium]|nr:iron-containing alcohol dehydrogenase [Lentisphaeria bacterium]
MNTDNSIPDYMALFEHYEPVCIDLGVGVMNDLCTDFLLEPEKHSAATFVIGGQSHTKSGARADLTNMVLRCDFESRIVCDVPAEPDLDDVRRIVTAIRESASTDVVAIGGGSVMDAAKAAWAAYQADLDVSELFGSNVLGTKFPGKEFKRIVAVPTTAGTGSEVTPYSNVVDRAAGVKRLIADEQIVPRMALVNPYYGRSMPDGLTVATALDALTHNIEALLNIHAKETESASNKWAVEAVGLICRGLPRALRDPNDVDAREYLCAAATIGGIQIAHRPTSLPHLGSFSLYGRIAHGTAAALLLGPFWRYYLAEPAVQERTMLLADVFPSKKKQKTPQDVVDAASAFIAKYSGVAKLSALPFFDTAMVDKIAADAALNPMKLASAPRPLDPGSATEIISGILKQEL